MSRILNAGKHLLRLVSSVLDLSKLEAGKMEIFPEQFELGPFIDALVATARNEAAEHSNTLAVDCPDRSWMLNTDHAKLQQAVFNIVSNAARYTRNGIVTIAARVQHGSLTIAVRDTGPGIRPEMMSNLFQNFTEAEDETSSKYGGTGLGLPLSQKLCHLLGGKIRVESEIGKGSCFTVTVPAEMGQPAAMAAPEDDEAPGIATAPAAHHILVIDDDPVDAALVERILGKEGYGVSIAQDSLTALDMANALDPAAIILDINMPAMDGWHVLRAIRSHEALCDCPVILLTVNDDMRLSRELGASAHLLKPVRREALLRLVGQLVQTPKDRASLTLSEQPELTEAGT
jgi:CheY-like chemotaxis protein/anti-sigma regulatory factor (Ser/Thr protein kinase)